MYENKGTLYIVATPIGNLLDITLRAIQVLKLSDIVLCEDTRVTRRLCNKYGIHTKLVRFDHNIGETVLPDVIKWLDSGMNLALVSDAGTPLISDPGILLVKRLYGKYKIVPIPGSSAITAFLSVLPFEYTNFLFLGFLPKLQEEKENLLSVWINKNDLLVIFFETADRLYDTLLILSKISSNCVIGLGKELTKKNETIIVDTVDNLLLRMKNDKMLALGEFICAVKSSNEKQQK